MVKKAYEMADNWEKSTRGDRKHRAQVSAGGIISLIVGFVVIFHVLNSTATPLGNAAGNLSATLAASSLEGVSGLQDLPDVSVLLFYLAVIFSIILVATRGL